MPASAAHSPLEAREAGGDLVAVHCRQDRSDGKTMWWELRGAGKGWAGGTSKRCLYTVRSA